MNQETLKIFAQVKLASRKAGFDVDLAKLVADNDYARLTLDKLIASGIADLAALANQAKATLTTNTPVGNAVPVTPVAASMVSPEPETTPNDKNKKYVFGARG